VDLITEMSKSMINAINDGIINLILINKIHAHTNWIKTDQQLLKTISHKSIKVIVEKLMTLFQKL
jgi:hypothetical protein